jgi:hypothetical protein
MCEGKHTIQISKVMDPQAPARPYIKDFFDTAVSGLSPLHLKPGELCGRCT